MSRKMAWGKIAIGVGVIALCWFSNKSGYSDGYYNGVDWMVKQVADGKIEAASSSDTLRYWFSRGYFCGHLRGQDGPEDISQQLENAYKAFEYTVQVFDMKKEVDVVPDVEIEEITDYQSFTYYEGGKR